MYGDVAIGAWRTKKIEEIFRYVTSEVASNSY